jgi:hypothetical protein
MEFSHLYKMFSMQFGFDIIPYGWKLEETRNAESTVDIPGKRILINALYNVKPTSVIMDLLLIRPEIKYGEFFEYSNGSWSIKENLRELFFKMNTGWVYTTVDGYLVLTSEFDLVVTYPQVSSEESLALYAKSEFMNVSQILYVVDPKSNIQELHTNGTVYIPQPPSSSTVVITNNILHYSTEKLVFELFIVKNDQNEIKKSASKYTYLLKSNKIEVIKEDIKHQVWMECIFSHLDFHKNPNNFNVWGLLEDVNGGGYFSDTLFINSADHVYINTSHGWILVQYQWFIRNSETFRELDNEYRMAINIISHGK